MKIRLGLVGPADAVKLIGEVVAEYGDTFDYITITQTIHTENIEAMLEAVRNNIEHVDVFIFSGRLPYTIATNHLDIAKPCFYVPHNTSCLYKTLWQAKEAGVPLDKISFDMINPKEIYEALDEVGLQDATVYTSEYEEGSEVNPVDLARWHYDLWKSKKINVAITCIYSSHQVLVEKGVPSFRALYPRSAIRQTLEEAIHEVTQNRLKVMQISVILFNIDNFSRVVKNRGSEYAVQKVKLELLNLLLDFARTIQGSVFTFGGDDYIIFSTRGAIISGTEDYSNMAVMEEVRRKLDLTISCGIGFGKTVYGSELNARIGLSHAKDAGGDCVYIVEEDGSMRGPLGKPTMLSYSMNSDAGTVKMAGEIGLRSSHINKLKAIRESIGEEKISASKLAAYLNVTERSARRILGILAARGYAVEAGEETSGKKGRPRKAYYIKL